MKTFVLSALFALGLAVAGTTGASAAPASAGLSNLLSSSTMSQSLVEEAQYRRGPRYRSRRICRQVRVCDRGRYGRMRCTIRTVCRR